MSAERECFKLMDRLLVEKGEFNARYFAYGGSLVRLAIHEFMMDHPEVSYLCFDIMPRRISVNLGTGTYLKVADLLESRTESRDKLAKCLLALHDRFVQLEDIVLKEYGRDEVLLLNEYFEFKAAV